MRVYTSKLTPDSVVTYLLHDCERSLWLSSHDSVSVRRLWFSLVSNSRNAGIIVLAYLVECATEKI